MNFAAQLNAHSIEQGNAEALLSSNRSLSYSTLNRAVQALALRLNHLGWSSADVVGIKIEDEIENLIAVLAVMYLGAKQITLATHDSSQMHESLVQRVGVTKIFDSGTADIAQLLNRLSNNDPDDATDV